MNANPLSLPSGIYSYVTTALSSRFPTSDVAKSRRMGSTAANSALQTPQPRSRSSSLISTNSLDSTATTLISSGVTTPSRFRASLHVPTIADILDNTRTPSPTKEQRSGPNAMNLDFAKVGANLADVALHRLSADTTDTSARVMYIDAVKYMIRGLPQDLSEAEQTTLNLTITSHTLEHNPVTALTSAHTTSQQDPSASFVRASSARIVNILLSTLFSLILLGLPIGAFLFTRAIEYERRHRLAERAMQASRGMAGTASTTLVRMSKSRSGAYCLASVLCLVQSVLEGAGDGINRSMVDFGTRLAL